MRPSGAPLVVPATSNIDAYTLYLKGRYLLFKLTLDGLTQGMDHLKRAIALQPDYADAYASMAYGYLLHGLFSLAAPTQVMPLAKAAAESALRLNPNLAEGHLALATVRHWYDWDWPRAESAYRRAIELAPADGNARFNYAEFLISRGRFGEAIEEAARAIELDPVSLIVNRAMGDALYVSGRFDEAIAHAKQAIAIEPSFFSTYWILGLSLAGKGQYTDAVEAFERGRPYAHGDAPLEGFLGWAAALAGDRGLASTIAQQLETRRASGHVAASNIGLVYQGLGDMDEAVRWYRLALAERSGECVAYLNNPHFAAARADPRFQEILSKVEAGAWEPTR
jgi:serine/threonine-protein kinase